MEQENNEGKEQKSEEKEEMQLKEEEMGTEEELAETVETEEEKAEEMKGEETKEESTEISKEEEIVTPAEEEIAEAPTEEEAKPPERRKAEEEEEIVEERIYTIPLGKTWIMPPNKRAPKAMRIIKEFITRHMKLETRKKEGEEEEPKRLVITNEVNEKVWKRGIEKPPRNIRVRATRDKEGNVTVYLAEGD